MVPLASTGSVIAASTASTRLRGPLIVIVAGSGIDVPDLVAGSEGAENPRTHRNLAGKTSVEGEVKLAGNDLHDFQLPRLMDLLRRQIERALPRLHSAEFDLGVNIRRLQAPHNALRTPHPDLRPAEYSRY